MCPSCAAAATHAPLKLLGAAGDDGRDASRQLSSASLVVQQFAGITTEPILVDRSPEPLGQGRLDPPGEAELVQATGQQHVEVVVAAAEERLRRHHRHRDQERPRADRDPTKRRQRAVTAS